MKIIMLLATITAINLSLAAFAADPAVAHDTSKMNMNLSKEDREKMAVAHEKMAACLRSDQEVSECHNVLHKECQSMMGGSCGGMDMGKGTHRAMKQKR